MTRLLTGKINKKKDHVSCLSSAAWWIMNLKSRVNSQKLLAASSGSAGQQLWFYCYYLAVLLFHRLSTKFYMSEWMSEWMSGWVSITNKSWKVWKYLSICIQQRIFYCYFQFSISWNITLDSVWHKKVGLFSFLSIKITWAICCLIVYKGFHNLCLYFFTHFTTLTLNTIQNMPTVYFFTF